MFISEMASFRCFLKTPPSFPWIQIPILVITLSMLLSNYCGIWLKTCLLVLVLLSVFIFSLFLTPAESNLDNRSENKDANLSNELEKKLLFQESQLHEAGLSDVAKNGGKENSDMEWPYSSSKLPLLEKTSSQDFSDGSISDEESLIELEIPSGIYVASPIQAKKGSKEEDEEFINILRNFHQLKKPDFDFFDTETNKMLKKQSILDLLTEMNIEEENLIEIDITMGSIKCPRFEIEA